MLTIRCKVPGEPEGTSEIVVVAGVDLRRVAALRRQHQPHVRPHWDALGRLTQVVAGAGRGVSIDVQRYIELNLFWAGMVLDSEEHRWRPWKLDCGPGATKTPRGLGVSVAPNAAEDAAEGGKSSSKPSCIFSWAPSVSECALLEPNP